MHNAPILIPTIICKNYIRHMRTHFHVSKITDISGLARFLLCIKCEDGFKSGCGGALEPNKEILNEYTNGNL